MFLPRSRHFQCWSSCSDLPLNQIVERRQQEGKRPWHPRWMKLNVWRISLATHGFKSLFSKDSQLERDGDLVRYIKVRPPMVSITSMSSSLLDVFLFHSQSHVLNSKEQTINHPNPSSAPNTIYNFIGTAKSMKVDATIHLAWFIPNNPWNLFIKRSCRGHSGTLQARASFRCPWLPPQSHHSLASPRARNTSRSLRGQKFGDGHGVMHATISIGFAAGLSKLFGWIPLHGYEKHYPLGRQP